MAPDDTVPEPKPEDNTTPDKPHARAPRLAWDSSRYRLGDVLGRGGMGEVIAAHDLELERDVAIKRLLDDRHSEHLESRFVREARVQGRLDHPSIPPVYDIGRDREGRPYMVMKRLSGTTLAEILKQVEAGTIPYARETLLRAFVDVCLAVELAHARGVIHRDIKPSNIMLGEFGEVYVLDWGVAKLLGASDADDPRLPLSAGSGDATLTGAAIGTPSHMAPEQRDGRHAIDARADVYALGRTLCEILAAKRLRTAAASDAERRASQRAPERDVPPELDELCYAATAPEAGDRIAAARVLADGVQHYLDGDRDLALRKKLAADHLGHAYVLHDRDETHTSALREGARALALDPTLAAAADLVGRLMLETPQTTPPEVESSLAQLDRTVARRNARVGMIAYLGYVAVALPLTAFGLHSPAYPAAFVATSLVLALAAWYGTRTPAAPWRVPVIVVGNAVLVAICARAFPPMTIAPGIAAITAMVLFISPAFRDRWMVPTALVLLLGVALPWAAEEAGWLTPTHANVEGGILLSSPALDLRELGLGVGLVYTAILLGAAAIISRVHARAQRQAERQLHLQAWRLRQLVPERA